MSMLAPAAPATSRAALRRLTWQIRKTFGCDADPYLPVEMLFELALPQMAPGFTYDIVEDHELRGALGLTELKEKKIYLRQSVYEGAVNGVPRDRFTVVHELGHAVLHPDIHTQRPRMSDSIRPFENPEWQANTFAAELLVAAPMVRGMWSPSHISTKFGVSEECADIQFRQLGKDRLL